MAAASSGGGPTKGRYCLLSSLALVRKDKVSAASSMGYLYILRDNRNGYIKIGFAAAAPTAKENPNSQLIFDWKGSLAEELELHNRFSEYRIRGEWFDLNTLQTLGILREIGEKIIGPELYSERVLGRRLCRSYRG